MAYPNWFELVEARSNFEKFAPKGDDLTYLQIGVYTGDATKWLCDNALTGSSRLYDVDTWLGSDEPVHKNMDFNDVYITYLDKNREFIDKGTVIPYRATSDEFFVSKPKHIKFDFIYVDGDHTAFQVMKDGINSFMNLNQGGILAFDDYTWSLNQGALLEPKPAIDWIFSMIESQVEVLVKNSQLWLKRL